MIFLKTQSWQCCQLVFPYIFAVSPSFDYYDVSKYEIRFERIPGNYISRLHIPSVCFVSYGTAKMHYKQVTIKLRSWTSWLWSHVIQYIASSNTIYCQSGHHSVTLYTLPKLCWTFCCSFNSKCWCKNIF